MTSSPLERFSGKDASEAGLRTPGAEARVTSAHVIILALGILYALQAISPLRLDNDSVVYLHMATNIVDGLPVDSRGLPPGYPAMIALLDKAGLGYAFVFTLMNLAFFALGLASIRRLFARSRDGALWIIALSMLSVVFIRYIPMPQPEAMFFGVSLAAVAVMTSAISSTGKRRFLLLGIAAALTLLAITVRFVGFALLPAMLWSCFHREPSAASRRVPWSRSGKLLAAGILIGVAAVALVFLVASFRKYSSEAALGYTHRGVVGLLVSKIDGFLWTIGELTINIPWTRLPSYQQVFALTGLATLVAIAVMVRIKMPRTPAGIYLLSFLVVLAAWPYNAMRLWLPVVPLIIGCLRNAPLRFETGPRWRLLTRVYYAWFAIVAAAALAYTTRITFSGKDFPRVYGKAGGMSAPDPKTGRVDTEHNERARALQARYGNPF